MSNSLDFVVLSHLRWDFLFQRPQHLMTRCSSHSRVFFVEEPVYDAVRPRLEIRRNSPRLYVAVPHLPPGASLEDVAPLLSDLFGPFQIQRYVLWYYTPMALKFSSTLQPVASVYDCMDELSAFREAPTELQRLEQDLFRRVDLVFTGGQTLYESKKTQHSAVYAFPSSVDTAHFRQARRADMSPPDQASIAHPRIGYYGAIDERIDLPLLAGVADARPDWHWIMVGPTIKIEAADLPKRANLHYLGAKTYAELPLYLSGWDVAMMPFALNESTRFISPTKTPEYLAGGRPVVSSAITDVVVPYADKGLVHIASGAEDWVLATEAALSEDRAELCRKADDFLRDQSWDKTWAQMDALIEEAAARVPSR